MKMETTHLPTVHETVLPDPDCTLFVDGSRFADEQGRYHTGFAVTTVDQVLQASPLPPSMSAQEAELKALTVACQMFEGKRVNIYTDSRYALGVAHDFGLIKTRGFLTATGTPVKHGTAIKELMDALLLPEEVAILKVKAHGRRNSEETCGNHKADQAAKDAACESREVDRRVSGEEIPIFPMQTLPTDLKFLKEQQAAVSPEEKESWKQKGATLQDGVYTSNLKFCLPKSMYPPVVQWAHGAAHLSKTLMNSLITKYFEAPGSGSDGWAVALRMYPDFSGAGKYEGLSLEGYARSEKRSFTSGKLESQGKEKRLDLKVSALDRSRRQNVKIRDLPEYNYVDPKLIHRYSVETVQTAETSQLITNE
ncbi:LOW QUALITY PROTEIN: uncharacterized protein RCH25_025709 [Pelodytes ibericus]